MEVLESEPSLQHLAAHAAFSLAPGAVLEVRGERWGEAREGATQGDPESGVYFGVAIQPHLVELDNTLSSAGGMARCAWDDCYAVGPPRSSSLLLNCSLRGWKRSVV